MNVEVVLQDDVEGTGMKNDIRLVSKGYARNYLLPLGLAVIATPSEREKAQKTAQKRTAANKSN